MYAAVCRRLYVAGWPSLLPLPAHPVCRPLPLPRTASKAILALEGVVDHGLFLDMVDVCIIAGSNGVEVKERKN